MKKNHYFILIGAALLLSLLILPQSFLEKTAYRLFHSPGKIGEVREEIGKSEKAIGGSMQLFEVSAGDEVNPNDTFITHGDSKVLFDFDPPFWIMPYSKIEFLKSETGIVGHLIYGEIKKLPADAVSASKSEAQPITLTYQEKMIVEENFSSSGEVLDAPLVAAEDFKDLDKADGVPKNLIEKQIFHSLLQQRKFFQSCLIKLYKKNNGGIKSGETVFDLLIQVNGVIEKTTVSKSDIQDQEYIDCLKQVFARVHFKNLQIKEPLHALFPLNIEMP